MPSRSQVSIHDWLSESARLHPNRIAIEEGDTDLHLTYAQLDALSDRLRDRLAHMGVRRGDRVAFAMRKSIDAVATMYGVLKVGAAYVPLDPTAPVSRNAYIVSDCQVKVLLAERMHFDAFRCELHNLSAGMPLSIVLEGVGGGRFLDEALSSLDVFDPAVVGNYVELNPDDLAYILYTSGSTGRPKGVMLSHQNGSSFIDWCSEIFRPSVNDRFSSHAPYHFDLSILDVHLPIKHGATQVIISHELGREPNGLAKLIHDRQLTFWYSAPSILTLLAQHGQLNRHYLSQLRIVLFAGEVFPIKHLRLLKSLVPHPAYFNLYGPTETNVCTYYGIPDEVEPDRTEPYPIGRTCEHLRSKVIMNSHEVAAGEEGELLITGPGVMLGYWNQPEHTEQAFMIDNDGRRWYRTGDIVVDNGSGEFTFRGRRDRMVKRRGYRVELGEIEACLYRHQGVREAAAVAVSGAEGVIIEAVIALAEGVKPSQIAMKQFCSQQIPLYMIPDRFKFLDALPKTSTDKINYQQLKDEATPM